MTREEAAVAALEEIAAYRCSLRRWKMECSIDYRTDRRKWCGACLANDALRRLPA